jgi:transcriptional regulator with XRE-family HTH domain
MRREPELLREFGQYVKEQRQQKGMRLRQVARAAQMSATYLSQIERGEQRWPTEEILVNLANALAHSSSDLLFRAGRLSSDVLAILKGNPEQYSVFLHATKGLTAEELDQVVRLSLLAVRALLERKRAKKSRGKPDDKDVWTEVSWTLEKEAAQHARGWISTSTRFPTASALASQKK